MNFQKNAEKLKQLATNNRRLVKIDLKPTVEYYGLRIANDVRRTHIGGIKICLKRNKNRKLPTPGQ